MPLDIDKPPAQDPHVPADANAQPALLDRVILAYRLVHDQLMIERNIRGHWEGKLSTSALSTATAVMALEMVRRGAAPPVPSANVSRDRADFVAPVADIGPKNAAPTRPTADDLAMLIERGVRWIAAHQNADGGWGDTIKSLSNISTTMLCHAVFHATSNVARCAPAVAAAAEYLDKAGGVPALRARYGSDKTFSIPILTHCALAGLVAWREVSALPFELACIPAGFYKRVHLPVVSYALPALIAIGLVRHHFVKPRNPLVRVIRNLAIKRSLAILEKIQPASGGFLEAAPLTSFVTMSLAGMGLAEHPVAQKGVEFLIRSVRPDGSWPIDTNLSTWVTTLSINALGTDLPVDAAVPLSDWLLAQQYREVHPYTNADPGGWAWTDLSGGVPDADDTPGAILALHNLDRIAQSTQIAQATDLSTQGVTEATEQSQRIFKAVAQGVRWLLDLQNGDGGWPTFCRGWGTLPFDRSAPDLTAHALRALIACGRWKAAATDDGTAGIGRSSSVRHPQDVTRAMLRGFGYLERVQRADGSWLPLWFGNQYATHDENPTYGTARVLAAYRDSGRAGDLACQRGVDWLKRAQNADGGWGGDSGIVSSIEETALALEVLLSLETSPTPSQATAKGLKWLLSRIDNGKLMEPSPIGFYFAKLWYFEKLYPLIFTAAALRRATALLRGTSGAAAATGAF